jgi:hypothetical protein
VEKAKKTVLLITQHTGSKENKFMISVLNNTSVINLYKPLPNSGIFAIYSRKHIAIVTETVYAMGYQYV